MLAGLMLRFALLLVPACRAAFLSHGDLVIENIALRQQLAVFACSNRRPRITSAGRLVCVALRRVWWSQALLLVRADTVVQWHRAGFRKYWNWLSRRARAGRPSIDSVYAN